MESPRGGIELRNQPALELRYHAVQRGNNHRRSSDRNEAIKASALVRQLTYSFVAEQLDAPTHFHERQFDFDALSIAAAFGKIERAPVPSAVVRLNQSNRERAGC